MDGFITAIALSLLSVSNLFVRGCGWGCLVMMVELTLGLAAFLVKRRRHVLVVDSANVLRARCSIW